MWDLETIISINDSIVNVEIISGEVDMDETMVGTMTEDDLDELIHLEKIANKNKGR